MDLLATFTFNNAVANAVLKVEILLRLKVHYLLGVLYYGRRFERIVDDADVCGTKRGHPALSVFFPLSRFAIRLVASVLNHF